MRLQPRLLVLVGLRCSASRAHMHEDNTKADTSTDCSPDGAANRRAYSYANGAAYYGAHCGTDARADSGAYCIAVVDANSRADCHAYCSTHGQAHCYSLSIAHSCAHSCADPGTHGSSLR